MQALAWEVWGGLKICFSNELTGDVDATSQITFEKLSFRLPMTVGVVLNSAHFKTGRNLLQVS